MKIDVEEVLKLATRRREINHLDFDEIEWYQNGEKIDIPPEQLEQWRFMGMNNMDFVTCSLCPEANLGYGITTLYITKDKE